MKLIGTFTLIGLSCSLFVQGFKSPHLAPVERLPKDIVTLTLGSLIKAEAEAQSLNHALLVSLIATESNFDYKAKSKVGALGLMQVMPSWIKSPTCPHVHSKSDLLDPRLNLECGSSILKGLLAHYDQKSALVAYNAGERCLKTKNCPKSSLQYAKTILNTSKRLQKV